MCENFFFLRNCILVNSKVIIVVNSKDCTNFEFPIRSVTRLKSLEDIVLPTRTQENLGLRLVRIDIQESTYLGSPAT